MGIFPKVGEHLSESCLPTHTIQLFLSIVVQSSLWGAENEEIEASTYKMHPRPSFNHCCKNISLVPAHTSAIKTGLLPHRCIGTVSLVFTKGM